MNPFLITTYAPDFLDDPQLTELTAGKNRTCLKFPSYAVYNIKRSTHSIIALRISDFFKIRIFNTAEKKPTQAVG